MGLLFLFVMFKKCDMALLQLRSFAVGLWKEQVRLVVPIQSSFHLCCRESFGEGQIKYLPSFKKYEMQSKSQLKYYLLRISVWRSSRLSVLFC